MHIEQAVFTSALTDRSGGYQLIARSSGVTDAEARELSIWGPSHDSLLDASPAGNSVNFFPLAGGAWCISKTCTAGQEYSGRGGFRIYTQCLVTPGETLERFAFNPFAVLRATLASGALQVFDQPPKLLPPLRLGGRSPAVDPVLLEQVTKELGPARLARLVKAALDRGPLGIVSSARPENVFAALINCLPLDERKAFSFSTGLRYSPQRPFRLITVAADPAEHRSLQRRAEMEILDLSADAGPLGSLLGWAGEVARCLAAGKFTELAEAIGGPQPRPTPPRPRATANTPPPTVSAPAKPATASVETPARRAPPRPTVGATAPARALGRRTPVVGGGCDPAELELLGRLDDCVFAALGGQSQAAEELRQLWPVLSRCVSPALLAESREQYVRRVIQTWRSCLEGPGIDTERAGCALDVLAELFGE
ncbi:MAG: hypothetical protein U0836_26510 [Pirellulales bacterium]